MEEVIGDRAECAADGFIIVTRLRHVNGFLKTAGEVLGRWLMGLVALGPLADHRLRPLHLAFPSQEPMCIHAVSRDQPIDHLSAGKFTAFNPADFLLIGANENRERGLGMPVPLPEFLYSVAYGQRVYFLSILRHIWIFFLTQGQKGL